MSTLRQRPRRAPAKSDPTPQGLPKLDSRWQLAKPEFDGEWVRLKGRIEYVRGVAYKPESDLRQNLNDDSYVLLRANNIKNGEIDLGDVQYVSRSKVKPSQLLRKGDILVCASSGSRSLVGKAALIKEDMSATFGTFCCVIRSLEGESSYLGHYFQSDAYRRKIEQACSGSNINNLKADCFFDLRVPVRKVETRGLIVRQLDALRTQIKMSQKQLSALDDLVKSQFVEMFGDPIEVIDGIALGSIALLKAGETTTSSSISNEIHDGLYPCYGGNGLRGFTAEYTHDGSYPLIGRQGALCGNVRMAVGKFKATEHAVVVQPSIEINRVWLFHYLRYDNLARLATGAAQPGLSVKNLNKVPVATPPLDLQRRFANFVAQVDKLGFDKACREP